MIDAPIALRRL